MGAAPAKKHVARRVCGYRWRRRSRHAKTDATPVLLRCRWFQVRQGYAERLPRALPCHFDELEPQVLAFVHSDKERARKDAAAATARWREGKPLSPIDGMP